MKPPLPFQVARNGIKVVRENDCVLMECGKIRWRSPIYTFDPYDERPWREALQSMYSDGVRLFSFLCPLTVVWKEDGSYDWSLLDALHDEILFLAPDALLMPRLFLSPPDWWVEKYPEEKMSFSGPEPYILPIHYGSHPLWRDETRFYHGSDNPSMASEIWRKDAGKVLENYVKRMWKKYPGHFWGFQPAFGSCGEWTVYGTFFNGRFGTFGFDQPTVKAFRSYLDQRYPGEDHSQCMPPSRLERLATDCGCWKIPENHQLYLDWCDFHAKLKYETMNYFCSIIKASCPVPIITLVFGGYRMQTGASVYMTHFAKTSLVHLLAQPAIDALATPNWYVARCKGVFTQSVPETIARHKLFITENDVHARPHKTSSPYFPESTTEGDELFRRDTAYSSSIGSGWYWWYDFGCYEYRSRKVHHVVRSEIKRMANEHVTRRKRPMWAVIIDERSDMVTEGACSYFRQFREFCNHLWGDETEAPDVLTLNDWLEHAAEDNYRLCIFRDSFYLPADIRRKVRATLNELNISAIWFYAAGQITEKSFSTEAARELTGFSTSVWQSPASTSLTLLNGNSPFTSQLSIPLAAEGTDSLGSIFFPVVYLDDPEAEILGQLESLELPGIGVKYRGNNAFDLWAATPYLPRSFWENVRSICRENENIS
ncbi:MAG: hypothetical protein E7050_01795 [Lentisphaerae bacterium]|nr:hypothetical protein [Lentisphaerota bacterium]